MLGNSLNLGDKVVFTVESYLGTGTLIKYCESCIKIKIEKCTAYPSWLGERYINYSLVDKKIVKL
jgi:hypothetical protein